MACDLTLGRKEPCKKGVGGLMTVYFINYDRSFYSNATFTDGKMTGLPYAVPVFQYDLKGNNSFDEENINSRATGANFWSQIGTLNIKTQDLITQKELKILSKGRPQIIVRDNNNNYRLAGAENGCECIINTASGASMGDLNGYEIIFKGTEKAPADFIDDYLMSSIIGFYPTIFNMIFYDYNVRVLADGGTMEGLTTCAIKESDSWN